MNERIKELMKQADYPAPEIALRAQKLIELVIEECYRVVVSNPNIGTSLAAHNMKKHFGIE